MSEGPERPKWLVTTALAILLSLGVLGVFSAPLLPGHLRWVYHEPGDWVLPALGSLILVMVAHRSGLMGLPWLLTGMLAGLIVGILVIPAEARVGLPLNYAVRPIIGAAAGAVIGAIVERRRAGKSSENVISD
jgi:hypothetical protein